MLISVYVLRKTLRAEREARAEQFEQERLESLKSRELDAIEEAQALIVELSQYIGRVPQPSSDLFEYLSPIRVAYAGLARCYPRVIDGSVSLLLQNIVETLARLDGILLTSRPRLDIPDERAVVVRLISQAIEYVGKVGRYLTMFRRGEADRELPGVLQFDPGADPSGLLELERAIREALETEKESDGQG